MEKRPEGACALLSEAKCACAKFRKKLSRFFITLVPCDAGHTGIGVVEEMYDKLILYLGSKEGIYAIETGSKLERHHVHAIVCVDLAKNSKVVRYGEVANAFRHWRVMIRRMDVPDEDRIMRYCLKSVEGFKYYEVRATGTIWKKSYGAFLDCEKCDSRIHAFTGKN